MPEGGRLGIGGVPLPGSIWKGRAAGMGVLKAREDGGQLELGMVDDLVIFRRTTLRGRRGIEIPVILVGWVMPRFLGLGRVYGRKGALLATRQNAVRIRGGGGGTGHTACRIEVRVAGE